LSLDSSGNRAREGSEVSLSPNSWYRPDRLDFEILQEMTRLSSLEWDIRRSYASIAKVVGVDDETVRLRVKRMAKTGLLGKVQLVPNPHLLGREAAFVELKVGNAATKDRIMKQISLIDGVVYILDFHGSRLDLMLYYRGESELNESPN
jgi:DNA-binding Lrp family transcriptional regulator